MPTFGYLKNSNADKDSFKFMKKKKKTDVPGLGKRLDQEIKGMVKVDQKSKGLQKVYNRQECIREPGAERQGRKRQTRRYGLRVRTPQIRCIRRKDVLQDKIPGEGDVRRVVPVHTRRRRMIVHMEHGDNIRIDLDIKHVQ